MCGSCYTSPSGMPEPTWLLLRRLHGVKEYDPARDGQPDWASPEYARQIALWRAWCGKQQEELAAEVAAVVTTTGATDGVFAHDPLLDYLKAARAAKAEKVQAYKAANKAYSSKQKHALKMRRK